MLKTIAYSLIVYLILASPEKNVLRTKNYLLEVVLPM